MERTPTNCKYQISIYPQGNETDGTFGWAWVVYRGPEIAKRGTAHTYPVASIIAGQEAEKLGAKLG